MIIIKDLYIYNPSSTILLVQLKELVINEKNICFLKGDSGRGKTLLLKTLTNQYSFFAGNIIINEKLLETYSDQEFASIIQFVDQQYQLFSHMTTLEQLLNPLRIILKKNSKLAEEIAKNALNEVGLFENKNKYPHELSGGQKQRVAILQKILLEPEYLFLDEPTSGLDQKNKYNLLYLLQRNFQAGMKIILSSHDCETINFFEKKLIVDL